jgi:hypothetical protein
MTKYLVSAPRRVRQELILATKQKGRDGKEHWQ